MISQIGSSIIGEQSHGGWSTTALNRDGSRIVVGAYTNGGPNGSDGHMGHARVFEKDSAGNWNQLGPDIDGEFAGDEWGDSVAINGAGDRIVMGAPYHGVNNTGKAVVYEYRTLTPTEWANGTADRTSTDSSLSIILGYPGGTYDYVGSYWIQVGNFIGIGSSEYLGKSVSIDEAGNTIAIGAPSSSHGTLSDHGEVRVYEFNDATSDWDEVAYIIGEVAGEQMGRDGALSLNSAGNILIVGGTGKSLGVVRVYEDIQGTWTKRGGDMTGAYSMGAAVDVNGDGTRVIMGAAYEDSSHNDEGSFSVYDYDHVNHAWTLNTKVFGNAASFKLGTSVAMDDSGTHVIVGAHFATNYSGHARVLEYENGAWNMIQEYAGAGNDYVGKGVAMSADGFTYAFSSALYHTDYLGTTDIYQILNDSAQSVADTISGTAFAPNVVTDANNDINHGIDVNSTSSEASAVAITALGHFSSETSAFGDASFTKSKKRSVIRHLLKQAVGKLISGRFTLTSKAAFLNFIEADDATIDLHSKVKEQIEVVQPGTAGLSLDASLTSVYCPFGDGESQTFTDTYTGREFTMGLSGTTFTLTVDGVVPPNFTGVADQEGQVYMYEDAVNSAETTFVWGSGTASTSSTMTAEQTAINTAFNGLAAANGTLGVQVVAIYNNNAYGRIVIGDYGGALALLAFPLDGTHGATEAVHLRSLLRNILRQSSTEYTWSAGKADLFKFLGGSQAAQDAASDDIRVMVPSTTTVVANLVATTVYCPYEDGETCTIEDQTTGKFFQLSVTGGVYSLSVGPDVGSLVPVTLPAGQNAAGDTFEYTEIAGTTVVFTWGSVVVSGSSSGGGSGDPYLATMLSGSC